jgi:hypothetical protein
LADDFGNFGISLLLDIKANSIIQGKNISRFIIN